MFWESYGDFFIPVKLSRPMSRVHAFYSMRFSGLPQLVETPRYGGTDEKSQSRNLSLFGHLRLTGMFA